MAIFFHVIPDRKAKNIVNFHVNHLELKEDSKKKYEKYEILSNYLNLENNPPENFL